MSERLSCTSKVPLHEILGREELVVMIPGQAMSKEPPWRGREPGLKGQPLFLALNSDPEL